MENEEDIFGDLMNMCRLCSATTTLVNIFDTRLRAKENLAEVVEVTTGVRISPTDEISPLLCRKCTHLTIMMFKFRTNSMLNDLELREKAFKRKVIDKSIRELLRKYPKLIIPPNITKLNISPRVSLRRCETSLTEENDDNVLRKKRKTDEKCSVLGKRIAEPRVESTLPPSIHTKNPESLQSKEEISMSTTQHLAEDIILGAPAVKKLKLNENLQKQEEQDKQKMNELKNQDEMNSQRDVEQLKQKEIEQTREEREKHEEEELKEKEIEGQKKNELKKQDEMKLQRDVENLKQKEIEQRKEEGEKHEEKEQKKKEMEGPQEEITPGENDKSLFIVKQIHKRTFICEMCAKVHYSIKELKKHQIIHRRCSLCKNVVGGMTQMKEHEKICLIRNIMNNLPTIHIRRCEEIEEFRKEYSEAFEFLDVIEISDDEEDISFKNSDKHVLRMKENNIDNAKKNIATIQQSPVANTTNRENNASSETSEPSNPNQLAKKIDNLNPAGEQMETSTVVETRIPSSDNIEQKQDKVKSPKYSFKLIRAANKELQNNSDKTETTSATTGTSSSSNLERKNEKFSIAKNSKKLKKVPRAKKISPQSHVDPIFPPKLTITDEDAICFDMQEEEMTSLKKLLRQMRNNETLASTCTQTYSPTNSDISYSYPNEEDSYVTLRDLRNHLSYSNIPVNISYNKLYSIKFSYENCSINNYKNSPAKSKTNIVLRKKHDKKVHERMKNNRDNVKKRKNSHTSVTNKKGDGNSTNAKKQKSEENERAETNETSSTKITTIANPNRDENAASTKSTERELVQNAYSNKGTTETLKNPEPIVHSQNDHEKNRMITVSNKSASMESITNITKNSSISTSSEIRGMTDDILNKLMTIGKPQQPVKIVEISPRNQSVGVAKCSKKNTGAPPKVKEKKQTTRNVEILPKLTYVGPPNCSTKNIEPSIPISEKTNTNTKQVRKDITEIEKLKLLESQLFPSTSTVTNCSNASATGISTQAQTFIGNTVGVLNPTTSNSNSATAGSNVYHKVIRNASGLISNASNFPMVAFQMNNSQPVQNSNVHPTLGPLYVVNNNFMNSMGLVTSNQLQPNKSSPVTTNNIFNGTAPVVVSNSLVNTHLPVTYSTSQTSTISNHIPVVYSGQFQQTQQNFVTMQNSIPQLFTQNSNPAIPVSLKGPNAIITQGQGMAPSFVSTSSVQNPSAPNSSHISIQPSTSSAPNPVVPSQSTASVLPENASQKSKVREPVFISPRPPPMRKVSENPRIRIVSRMEVHGKTNKVGQNPSPLQNVATAADGTKYNIRVRNLSDLR